MTSVVRFHLVGLQLVQRTAAEHEQVACVKFYLPESISQRPATFTRHGRQLTCTLTAYRTTGPVELRFQLHTMVTDPENLHDQLGDRIAGSGFVDLRQQGSGDVYVVLYVTDERHGDRQYCKAILQLYVVQNDFAKSSTGLFSVLAQQADTQFNVFADQARTFTKEQNDRKQLGLNPTFLPSFPCHPLPQWVYLSRLPSARTIAMQNEMAREEFRNRLERVWAVYRKDKPTVRAWSALSWRNKAELVAHTVAHAARSGRYMSDLTYSADDKDAHAITEIETCPRQTGMFDDCEGLAQLVASDLFTLRSISVPAQDALLAEVQKFVRNETQTYYCHGGARMGNTCVAHTFVMIAGTMDDKSFVFAEGTMWIPALPTGMATEPVNPGAMPYAYQGKSYAVHSFYLYISNITLVPAELQIQPGMPSRVVQMIVCDQRDRLFAASMRDFLSGRAVVNPYLEVSYALFDETKTEILAKCEPLLCI